MQEHPIPQDITGYRFHIVGSMTLKQFAEVFVAVIIAVLIYSTNLLDVVKWPLIAIVVGLGLVAAFLPIEERPLSHWIVTFFSVLYKPTQFYWRRIPKIPEIFTFNLAESYQQIEPELDLSPARRARIKEYVVSVNTPSQYQNNYTDWEIGRMNEIFNIFDATQVPIDNSNQSLVVDDNQALGNSLLTTKPNVEVRVRNLRGGERQTELAPEFLNRASQEPSPAGEVVVYQQDIAQTTTDATSVIPATTATPVATTVTDVTADIATENSQPVQDNSAFQVLPQLNTPVAEPIEASAASLNPDLPFPDPPTEPNKIVGMVLTPNNELITGAIVEIKTTSGQILRAVKTNALGQFFVTTPLPNGKYIVAIDKDGYNFSPQEIILIGQIISPLEIRSF